MKLQGFYYPLPLKSLKNVCSSCMNGPFFNLLSCAGLSQAVPTWKKNLNWRLQVFVYLLWSHFWRRKNFCHELSVSNLQFFINSKRNMSRLTFFLILSSILSMKKKVYFWLWIHNVKQFRLWILKIFRTDLNLYICKRKHYSWNCQIKRKITFTDYWSIMLAYFSHICQK